ALRDDIVSDEEVITARCPDHRALLSGLCESGGGAHDLLRDPFSWVVAQTDGDNATVRGDRRPDPPRDLSIELLRRLGRELAELNAGVGFRDSLADLFHLRARLLVRFEQAYAQEDLGGPNGSGSLELKPCRRRSGLSLLGL